MRCSTWDHVETFYTRKLRGGRSLSMRLPFAAAPGDEITVALELPNELVLAIDGTVAAARADADGKTAVDILLHGMTAEVTARLQALVTDGRAGHGLAAAASAGGATAAVATAPRRARAATAPPSESAPPGPSVPSPLPIDAPIEDLVAVPAPPRLEELGQREREIFVGLSGELRTLRERAAHDVLGVGPDATVEAVRSAYFVLSKRYHPDVHARHRSAAVRHMAQEVFIHVNRAYDRLRAELAASGAAAVAGPALLPHRGWLASLEEIDDAAGAASSVATVMTTVTITAAATAAPAGTGTGRFKRLTEEHLFGDIADSGHTGSSASRPIVAPAGAAAVARTPEQVEAEARTLLAGEQFGPAREVLAAVVQAHPRHRRLRALYHLATALEALAAGRTMLATSQLETALAHDRDLREAGEALDELRKHHGRRPGLFRRLFK